MPRPLTDAERDAFLAASHVAVLAIPRGDRPPHASPVWYHHEPGGNVTLVKSLTGTRSDFRDEKVRTRVPLDRRFLYAMHRNGYKAMQLLPFIQMMESPQGEENACFFYRRIVTNVPAMAWHP